MSHICAAGVMLGYGCTALSTGRRFVEAAIRPQQCCNRILQQCCRMKLTIRLEGVRGMCCVNVL
jgi:hypothetical protein